MKEIVRHRTGELLLDCVKQTVKYPNKIMDWVVISWKGTDPAHVVNGAVQKKNSACKFWIIISL
jgi:hypothetical protein